MSKGDSLQSLVQNLVNEAVRAVQTLDYEGFELQAEKLDRAIRDVRAYNLKKDFQLIGLNYPHVEKGE
jgi:hypothetical protein